jgi:outer membrane protein with beta-barrel domain
MGISQRAFKKFHSCTDAIGCHEPSNNGGNEHMRKLLFVLFVLFVPSVSAQAQDHPRGEVWVTYSVYRADVDILDNETLHGYGLGAQWNLSPNFGFAGEFTSNHGASGPVTIFLPGVVVLIPDLDTTVRTFVAGPRISYRAKPVTVFAHALFGGANSKLRDENGISGFEDSNTEFAMVFGGGIDVNLGRHYAIRAGQFDYVPIHTDINQRFSGASSSWLHNFRYQVGFVFKL